MNAESKIVDAIRRRGSDARDLRDAAHESCHALESRLRRPWTRDRVHNAIGRLCNHGAAEMVASELVARAVEQRICVVFGIKYDAEHWALMCCMETLKTTGVAMPLDFALETIAIRSRLASTDAMVERIRRLK